MLTKLAHRGPQVGLHLHFAQGQGRVMQETYNIETSGVQKLIPYYRNYVYA